MARTNTKNDRSTVPRPYVRSNLVKLPAGAQRYGPGSTFVSPSYDMSTPSRRARRPPTPALTPPASAPTALDASAPTSTIHPPPWPLSPVQFSSPYQDDPPHVPSPQPFAPVHIAPSAWSDIPDLTNVQSCPPGPIQPLLNLTNAPSIALDTAQCSTALGTAYIPDQPAVWHEVPSPMTSFASISPSLQHLQSGNGDVAPRIHQFTLPIGVPSPTTPFPPAGPLRLQPVDTPTTPPGLFPYVDTPPVFPPAQGFPPPGLTTALPMGVNDTASTGSYHFAATPGDSPATSAIVSALPPPPSSISTSSTADLGSDELVLSLYGEYEPLATQVTQAATPLHKFLILAARDHKMYDQGRRDGIAEANQNARASACLTPFAFPDNAPAPPEAPEAVQVHDRRSDRGYR